MSDDRMMYIRRTVYWYEDIELHLCKERLYFEIPEIMWTKHYALCH